MITINRYEINKQIHTALKDCPKSKIVYLYKKYGEYQFQLREKLIDAMEKAFVHYTELGENIVDILEIFDYNTMTSYQYNDIKNYWCDEGWEY